MFVPELVAGFAVDGPGVLVTRRCGADLTTFGAEVPASGASSLPVTQATALPTPELPPGISASMLPELPKLSPAQVVAEAGLLHSALAAEVPHLLSLSADRERALIAQSQAEAAAGNLVIDRPQLVVVVDRNPRVQALMVVVANPTAPWEVIGGTRVSTGQPDRKLYYVTPTGVFLHTADILDFRAEGTFNENHIRGYGLKGMRIWDFGWQWATKGWRSDGERGQIRLQVHATDPQFLEQRIGRPASEVASGFLRRSTAFLTATEFSTWITSSRHPKTSATGPCFCPTVDHLRWLVTRQS